VFYNLNRFIILPICVENIAKIANVEVVTMISDGGLEGVRCRMCEINGKSSKCGTIGEWFLSLFKTESMH
jgi:hypothetical protein